MRRPRRGRVNSYGPRQLAFAFGAGLLISMFTSPQVALFLAAAALVLVARKA